MRMSKLIARLSRRNDWRAGNAAVEFALLAPALILLLLGIIDYGTGVYQSMQVQNAAEVGAEYAIKNGFNATAISSAVTSATNLQGISATPSPAQSCGCASGSTVSTATCGSTCPSGAAAGVYVTVSAQSTYSTLIPYPGIPNSFTFSSASMVRIQ